MLSQANLSSPEALDDAYRLAFQRSEEAVAILNLAQPARLADATDALLELWRLSRAGAVGRRLDEIFTARTTAKLIAIARKASTSKENTATVSELTTPEARLTDVDMRVGRLSEDFVALAVLSGTPQHEAPRRALIDDLALISGGLIYIYDLARKQTRYINSNLARQLGYGSDASVSLSDVMPLVHPDDQGSLAQHAEELSKVADGEVARVLFRVRRADGEWRWIDNRASVFARSASGRARRVIGYAYDVTAPRRTLADLAAASAALLNVEEKERRRIARELHDSTAQHLVAADLMLAAHERRLVQAPDKSLAEARDTIALALREIRTLSFLLHPPRLREQGLAKTLRSFAEGFARRAVLDTRIEIGELPADVSPEVELALFRVAQEALMNVRRHADADRVKLRLRMEDDLLALEIEDDGVGMGAVETVASGVGIDGMRARLSSLDGKLTLDSPSGGGTRVRAVVQATASTNAPHAAKPAQSQGR
ncbi:MAG: PAS domain-containing protein [Vitreimonas sp.]